MNIEKLDDKVKSLLDKTETEMFKLIEDYNESVPYVDTVDLNAKFDNLADYIEDYS